MSKAKKIISLLLSVIMIMSVFTVVPFSAGATEADTAETGAESGTTGDCTWTLDDNGVLTISGNGKMGDYDVDWYYDDYVTTAPWGSYSFNTVVIESGVTSIGDYAFYRCTSLTSVTIPDSVTSIGYEAFYGCTGLTSVTIPDSVTNIGHQAFTECTGLTSITIPDFVTSIGSYAFSDTAWYDNQPDGLVYAGKVAYKMKGDCPSEVVIKDGTLGIADCAFEDCAELTSVTIPDSVTSIGDAAFRSCGGLTSIDIPDSVTSIGESAFSGCSSLTSVTIPDLVTSIGDRTFNSCISLESVTIPDSVKSIGVWAFGFCPNLKSITIPASVTSIDDSAFFCILGVTSYGFGYLPIEGFTIYGYEGSTAEKYAKDNKLTFIKLTEKTDDKSGIIASVPDEVELRVVNVLDQMPVGTIKAYDISLMKNGEAVQPENVVTVKIPCESENLKVYRINANGTKIDMNAKYKDGYYVFYTDHFSVYVLAEPEPEVVSVPGDVTGDGKTNVQDCTAILRYVRQLDTLSDDQLKIGDVTGDGKVNVQDVTRILRHVRQIEALY